MAYMATLGELILFVPESGTAKMLRAYFSVVKFSRVQLVGGWGSRR